MPTFGDADLFRSSVMRLSTLLDWSERDDVDVSLLGHGHSHVECVVVVARQQRRRGRMFIKGCLLLRSKKYFN